MPLVIGRATASDTVNDMREKIIERFITQVLSQIETELKINPFEELFYIYDVSDSCTIMTEVSKRLNNDGLISEVLYTFVGYPYLKVEAKIPLKYNQYLNK